MTCFFGYSKCYAWDRIQISNITMRRTICSWSQFRVPFAHIYQEGDEWTHAENASTRITHQPLPESFQPVPRWGLIVGVSLDLRESGVEVHIYWPNSGDSRPKLGADVQYGEQHERKVVRNKVGCVPMAPEEHIPAAELCGQSKYSLMSMGVCFCFF